MIREKLTLELDQELPYGIAVEIEAMGHDEGQLNVSAAIWVDRAGPEADCHRRRRRAASSAWGRKARLELKPCPGRAAASDLVGQGP